MLKDASGSLQIYAQRDALGADAYEAIRALDLGDIIAADGALFRTRTDELTLRATAVRLLVLFRAVDPLPWTGAVLGSVVTTAVVYVVFAIGLGTQFPVGLLGDR